MQKTLFLLAFPLFFLLSACFGTKNTTVKNEGPAQQMDGAAEPAFVQWNPKFIELGEVKKGERRKMQFSFKNVSDEDAKIDIVDACSCTTVEFPRGTIAPGEKATLDVVFDSTEKDAAETIEIRIIFQNLNKFGIPRIETVEYHFDLVK